MGASRQIYIGPYVEVAYPKTQATIDRCQDKFNCPDPEGREAGIIPHSYCPQCGISSKQRISVYVPRPDYIELLGHERLTAVSGDLLGGEFDAEDESATDVLIPNERFNPGGGRDVFGDESQDLTDVDMSAEREAFMNRYGESLKTLRLQFGDSHVHVRWGYISYWM